MTVDLKDVYGTEEPVVKQIPPVEPQKTTEPVIVPAVEDEDDDDDLNLDGKSAEDEDDEDSEEIPVGDELPGAEPPPEPEPIVKQVDVDEIVGKRTKEIRGQRDKIRDEKTDLEKLVAMGLKEMIHEGEDVKTALKRLAAENKGVKPEDIDKELQEAREFEAFKASKAETEKVKAYASVKQQNLAAIKEAFPEEKAASIEQIDGFDKFARLMATGGFNPVEAYALIKGSGNKAVNAYAKQKVMAESKEHLRPTNARSVAPTMLSIPKGDFDYWQAAYPNLTNTELVKKYNAGKKI